MSPTLDDQLFDLAMRTLNYSIEFVNTPGYASLRLMDLLQSLVGLSMQIEGISKKEFYRKVKEKMEDRRLMADQKERAEFLDELLTMFVDEWRKGIR